MVDYFTEVFPVDVSKIGQLTAYKVNMKKGLPNILVDDLLTRLEKAFSGNWIWNGQEIITDNAPSPVQIDISLDVLREEYPAIFRHLDSISENTAWFPSVEEAANFVGGYSFRSFDDEIRQILRKHGTRIPNGYVMRDYLLNGWEVDGQPALSFTLKSRVLYFQNVRAMLAQTIDVIGLQVIDKSNARNIGTITKVNDSIKKMRDELLKSTLSEALQTIIKDAEDDCPVVTVSFGDYSRQYPANSLNIILTSNSYDGFDIDQQSVEKASNLKPDIMADIVSSASDVLKNKGLIGKAYNNRINEQHFIYLDHVPEMEFGNKKVRPYKIKTLADDFIKHGLFSKHPRFKQNAIRIAVINTLTDNIASDFIEAMRRQMEKDFGLDIEMIKERNVRVVSEKNLASAVRAVEKETPHVLIACFADDQSAYYDYVHSLTVGKGIALQSLYESTMNNPEAMGRIIMGLLARTGNTPFVLAEPLESADLVMGLDWVREKMTRQDRVVGISRIYRRDGLFMRYFMDIHELENDAIPPKTMIQALFPAPIFKGKRVMIQHCGELESDLSDVLQQWGQEIEAELLLVEIRTEQVPHLYALQNGIVQAPWGSVYLLNPAEAFIVSSSPDKDSMPETIHIRVRSGDLMVEQAIYAVLALTLLNYGTAQIPRLPVTIQNAEKLAGWLARGMLPDNINGDVCFWL